MHADLTMAQLMANNATLQRVITYHVLPNMPVWSCFMYSFICCKNSAGHQQQPGSRATTLAKAPKLFSYLGIAQTGHLVSFAVGP